MKEKLRLSITPDYFGKLKKLVLLIVSTVFYLFLTFSLEVEETPLNAIVFLVILMGIIAFWLILIAKSTVQDNIWFDEGFIGFDNLENVRYDDIIEYNEHYYYQEYVVVKLENGKRMAFSSESNGIRKSDREYKQFKEMLKHTVKIVK